jgi:diguanylate cyclase (GGDEF)-like protein
MRARALDSSTREPSADAQEALTAAATSIGAADLFVFRRVTGDRFVHVGGVGRGEGWAGNVDLVLSAEEWAREAVDSQRPVRRASARPERVVGPYYQCFAALVPLSPDIAVVFGRNEGGAFTSSDADLIAAAAAAGASIDQVSPAKRLADELELLHAVRALVQTEARSLPDVMRHVVECAASALSCELGVIFVRDHDAQTFAGPHAPVSLSSGEVTPVAQRLLEHPDELPTCIQDSAERPLPGPLDIEAVKSYYVLPIGAPPFALLLLLHTEAQPRGFTTLCREVGLRLAEAAEPLLQTALKVDSLERELQRVGRDARIDALTRLENRRAWDEALIDRRRRPPSGVIVLDIDDLKVANDTHGHHFGDEMLRAVADTVRGAVREEDLVARLGGDELAVLLTNADEAVCEDVVGRIEWALEAHGGLRDFSLSVSIGYAASPPAASVADAHRRADERMYANKRLAEDEGGAEAPQAAA